MNLFESLSLISGAIILLFFPDSEAVFLAVVFGGTVIAFVFLYRLVTNPNLFRFGNITCFSFLFGYAVSTAVYAILSIIRDRKVNFASNDFGLSYGQSDISHGLLLIFILAVLLAAISKFEKPLLQQKEVDDIGNGEAIVVLVLSAAAILVAIQRGAIGYSGIYFVEGSRISWMGALCFIALPPLAVVNIICLFNLSGSFMKYKKILYVTCAIFLIAIFPTGRRVFMYTLIIITIVAGHYIITKAHKNKKMLRLATMLLAAILIFSYGYRSFYALRLVITRTIHDKRPTLTEIMPYYFSSLRDAYFRAELHERLFQNTTVRPFYLLSYLAGLLAAHEHRSTPFLGELRYSFIMAVPSLLYPEKTRKMPSSQEGVTHISLGLAVFDGSNSLVTSGLNDLGLFGIFLYPMGVVFLYILISRKLRSNLPPFLYIFIVLRLSFSLLYVEASLASLLTVGLRDLAIVVGLYWLILTAPIKNIFSRKMVPRHE